MSHEFFGGGELVAGGIESNPFTVQIWLTVEWEEIEGCDGD